MDLDAAKIMSDMRLITALSTKCGRCGTLVPPDCGIAVNDDGLCTICLESEYKRAQRRGGFDHPSAFDSHGGEQ